MTRKRILFFDEDSGVCRNYKSLLKSNGYELVSASTIKEIDDELTSCHLVFFGAPYTESKVELCRYILKGSPSIPVVFMLNNDTEFENEIEESLIRRVLRPLGSKKKFLSIVGCLIDAGEELGWCRAQESPGVSDDQSGQIQDLDIFSTLDLSQAMDKVVDYFGQRLNCRNITWFEANEFQKIVSLDDDENYDLGYQRTPTLRSWREENLSEIRNKLKIFLTPKAHTTQTEVRSAEVKPGVHCLMTPVCADDGETILGYLFIDGVETDTTEFIESMISEALAIMARHLRFCIEYWESQNKTFVDDLTSLYNQRYMSMVLDSEISRAERENKKFSVLFIDVDYFKMVNDTRGHWIGSRALVELGKLIKDCTRLTDYAFRYGGDEFVVILHNTDAPTGEAVAERIRKTIEETTFKIDGIELNVTVSIGLAVFPDHAKTSEQVLKMADQAMYYGKNKSRNIVYTAS